MADDLPGASNRQSDGDKPAAAAVGAGASIGYLKRSAGGVLHWPWELKLLDWIALALLAAVILQIGEDYFSKPVIIDPIIVPKVFEDAGYTPDHLRIVYGTRSKPSIVNILMASNSSSRSEIDSVPMPANCLISKFLRRVCPLVMSLTFSKGSLGCGHAISTERCRWRRERRELPPRTRRSS